MTRSTRITIDNLPMEASSDFAKNIANYDPTQGIEAPGVRVHAELAGTSSIYVSEVRTFLGLENTPSTWGHFPPPEGYGDHTNRFFLQRPFPASKSIDEEVAALLKIGDSLHERDQKILAAFAAEYKRIADLLAEANARRLALQKS